MSKILNVLLLWFFVGSRALCAESAYFEDVDPADPSDPSHEVLRREVKYETSSKATGWIRQKWGLNFRSDGKRSVGVFFVKNRSSEDSIQSHALGFHAGQSLRRAAFRFGLSQADRSFSESSARSSAWGSLRVSPLGSLKLFARYGKTWRDLVPKDEEEIDWGSFSAGFSLRALKALDFKFLYAPEKRMQCEMSYKW